MSARLLRPLAVALVTSLAGLAAAAGAQAQQRAAAAPKAAGSPDRKDAAATPQRQRELQAERRQLQQRIAALKKQLARAESSQSETSEALVASEAGISAASRRLHELAQAREQVERQLDALAERSRSVAARQTEQERQLGAVLRVQFALAQKDPWERLIDGDDPNRHGRELHYLGYLARAKADLIGQLGERRAELVGLREQSQDKRAELAAIAGDEESNRAQLLDEKAARKRALERLARQVEGQRRSIASLERDDRRLSSLIAEIDKLLAEQARRETQRRAAPRRPAEPVARHAAPAPAEEVEPPSEAGFARLRGKLPLPVNGEITARFGNPRRTEAGVDAPTWKGVFIRAAQGAQVRAVAAGRVVFADWLRGFGNLLILDHGAGFLSVYGNNEALLAGVGDRIEAGAAVAQVGDTGASRETGLYFEIRDKGRPVDPLRWAAAR